MLDKYKSELFIDYLIMGNVSESIEKNKNEIIDILKYENILYIINKVLNSSLYSLNQIEKIKKVIDYIIAYMINNEEDKIYIDILEEQEDKLNKVIPSYDFYYQEFIEKFNDLELFIKKPYQIIDKKEIENSVIFDYEFYLFLTESFDILNIYNIVNNPYFILSIKKFVYEKPELFQNEQIKKRTINLLNLRSSINPLEQEEIDSIIKKLDGKVFDYRNLKEVYIDLLIHKILVSNKNIEEYKNIILSDYFIDNLNQFLLDIEKTNNDERYGIDIKNRIEYILKYILDNRNNNEMKIKYNELIFNLNKVKFSETSYLYYDEANFKYSKIEMLKKIIKFDLKDDMIISIGRDFDTIELLLEDETSFLNKLSKLDYYYLYGIKKLLVICPELFYDDKINERKNKILSLKIKR